MSTKTVEAFSLKNNDQVILSNKAYRILHIDEDESGYFSYTIKFTDNDGLIKKINVSGNQTFQVVGNESF
jgi:hypothetical protein